MRLLLLGEALHGGEGGGAALAGLGEVRPSPAEVWRGSTVLGGAAGAVARLRACCTPSSGRKA